MQIVLGLLSVVFYLSAIGTCMQAKTAIHKIAGLVLVLIGAVFTVGAAVIEAIQTMRVKITKGEEGE